MVFDLTKGQTLREARVSDSIVIDFGRYFWPGVPGFFFCGFWAPKNFPLTESNAFTPALYDWKKMGH